MTGIHGENNLAAAFGNLSKEEREDLIRRHFPDMAGKLSGLDILDQASFFQDQANRGHNAGFELNMRRMGKGGDLHDMPTWWIQANAMQGSSQADIMRMRELADQGKFKWEDWTKVHGDKTIGVPGAQRDEAQAEQRLLLESLREKDRNTSQMSAEAAKSMKDAAADFANTADGLKRHFANAQEGKTGTIGGRIAEGVKTVGKFVPQTMLFAHGWDWFVNNKKPWEAMPWDSRS